MKFIKEWGFVVFWLVALVGLFSTSSRAADYSIKFGPSIENDSTDGSSKIFGVRREDPIIKGIYNAVELGGYTDSGGQGRKAAGLVKFQLGTKPGPMTGMFGKAFVGPCLISKTDTVLGGNFQFCTDIGVGIRDKDTFMDVGYGHVSSAGLESPNHGRDALIFETGLSFP